MSVRFDRRRFNQDQQLMLRKHLHMTPKMPYVPGRSKYANQPVGEPVRFYNTIGDDIYLPLAYAGVLIGQPPNRQLLHSPSQMVLNPNKILRPKQVPVVQEAFQYLNDVGGVHLGLHPGFGKTAISCYLACQLGQLTLVYLHREIYVKQWVTEFGAFTIGAKIWVVGEKFPELQPGEYLSVIICMNGRYQKIPSEIMRAVGTMIIDEAHNFCTPSRVGAMLAPQPKYVISCTATLERKNGMETMIKTLVGNTAIIRDYDCQFDYIEVQTGIKIPVEDTKAGMPNYSKFTNDVCADEFRNSLIVKLACDNLHRKILILSGRVSHAKQLCQVFKALGISCDYMAGKKKTYNDSRILIGSTSKIGEGFDEANFCEDYGGQKLNMLILATSVKAGKDHKQYVGRVFRADNPIVFDLIDDVRMVQKHWRGRKAWYKKQKGTAHKLAVPLDRKLGTLTFNVECIKNGQTKLNASANQPAQEL